MSATAECVIVIANTGDTPAIDVAIDLHLLEARIDQETALATLYAEPSGRFVAPSFMIAPGEERQIDTIASLPRGAIEGMAVGARRMFVPLITISIAYRSGKAVRRATRAFLVGVERVDSNKLAPFWLDAPPRSFDNVAARPQGDTVDLAL